MAPRCTTLILRRQVFKQNQDDSEEIETLRYCNVTNLSFWLTFYSLI